MQQYQLKQSANQNLFRIALYCLVLFAIGVFFHESILLCGLLGLLTLLLLYRDQFRYRLLKSRDPTIVTLRGNTTGVEFDRLRFERFRVFSSRWFLILQMRNEQSSKNVMLVPDRFNCIQEYLQFRYQIINMSRNQYVA